MKLRLITTIFFISLYSCNKIGFTTAPQLKFESVNTTFLSKGENLIFTLAFSDKEGDLADSLPTVMWVEKKIISSCIADTSLGYYPSAFFFDQQFVSGTIDVRYTYGTNGPYPIVGDPSCPDVNDTCIYRFVLKDRAGNTSDTVESPIVVIKKNN